MEFGGAQAHDQREFKSPNLNAERRRRRKLSERLLTLRSLVPIITNMNKATIIEDAITYIQELQKTSNHLTTELLELNSDQLGAVAPHKEEAEAEAEAEPAALMPAAADPDSYNYQLKEEVDVRSIDGGKVLIKMVFKRECGVFTKLVQAMSSLGLETTEICATSFKGAMLVSASLHQGTTCDDAQLQQTREFLSGIVIGRMQD